MLTNILKGIISFVEFLKRHKEFVKIFFAGMLLAITPVILSLTKMALVSSKAFAPFLKGAAIIAGIALVIEDIYGYFKGWDSVTGDLVKKFPALGKALEFIRPLVLGLEKAFQSIMTWLKDPTWENFLQIFVDIGNAVINTIKKPLEYVYQVVQDLISIAKDWVGGIFDKVGNIGSNFLNNIPFIGGSSTNTTNNNNNINVNQTYNVANGNVAQTMSKQQISDVINMAVQR